MVVQDPLRTREGSKCITKRTAKMGAPIARTRYSVADCKPEGNRQRRMDYIFILLSPTPPHCRNEVRGRITTPNEAATITHRRPHTHTHTCSSTAFTYLFHVLPLSRPQPPSQPHTLIHTTPPTTTHTPQTHQTLGWRPSGFATENPHDRFRFLHHFLGLPFGDMSPTYICKL